MSFCIWTSGPLGLFRSCTRSLFLTFAADDETKFGVFKLQVHWLTALGCLCSLILSCFHPDSLLSSQEASPCLSVLGEWLWCQSLSLRSPISGCWLKPNPKECWKQVSCTPSPFRSWSVYQCPFRQLHKTVIAINVARTQTHSRPAKSLCPHIALCAKQCEYNLNTKQSVPD